MGKGKVRSGNPDGLYRIVGGVETAVTLAEVEVAESDTWRLAYPGRPHERLYRLLMRQPQGDES
jgi:hypothetical protein